MSEAIDAIRRMASGQASLEDYETILRLRGYTIQRSIEGEENVVRIFRPDGSLAITARKGGGER